MNGWHALAAFLTLMTMRRAPHRITALHRLLRCGHADAIEGIARESDGEHYYEHSCCKPHDN